jgi:hypothetical protein
MVGLGRVYGSSTAVLGVEMYGIRVWLRRLLLMVLPAEQAD